MRKDDSRLPVGISQATQRRAIELGESFSTAKTARLLFPAKPEAARKWITGERELPAEHKPFVAHLLATIERVPESERETFLTAETIQRLKDGEVIDG